VAAEAAAKIGLDRVHELLSGKARKDHRDIPRARFLVLVALALTSVGAIQSSGCRGLGSRKTAVRDKEADTVCGDADTADNQLSIIVHNPSLQEHSVAPHKVPQ